MSCTPASRVPPGPHSTISITSPTDTVMDQIPTERRASRVYQIFPESPMTESECESWREEHGARERLPSIVVEPTEFSEMESGELCWPPVSQGPEEEEDPFQESSLPQTESSADGQQQDMSGVRKSSIGPAQTQLNFSRLTPPPSPTTPEAAPPCLRS